MNAEGKESRVLVQLIAIFGNDFHTPGEKPSHPS